MSIGRFLQNLGDSAYNTADSLINPAVAPTQMGVKPDDFGMRGAKPNHPMTRMAGTKLAGLGIGNAIAGEIANKVVLPAGNAAIGAGINYMKNNPNAILGIRTAF